MAWNENWPIDPNVDYKAAPSLLGQLVFCVINNFTYVG